MGHPNPVGPVVIHSADTIQYANRAFCALIGVDSPAELTGTSLLELVESSAHESLTERFDQLPRDDDLVGGVRLELLDTDGSSHDVIALSSLQRWDGDQRIQTAFITLPMDAAAHRSLYERAASQSPIGTTIAAASGDNPLLYVNETFVDLTGYSKEESIGRNCRFLQGESTREEPVAELREAIAAEEPVTVELRNYRKDGSLFWNRVTISPIEDATGTVTHFLGFQEEITDTKLYEAEKLLFETHAEVTDQVMFITDTEGTIEYVNPAFEQVTGYSAAEAVGNTPQILHSGEQNEAFYEELWETITAGDNWEAELTNRTKSGELYQAHQRIVPVTDEQGTVTHFVAIEPDITNTRLTQQVVTVLNRILRHNLRTSLNVIEGYTDLLETDISQADREGAIRTIRERTTALQRISDRTSALQNILAGNDEGVAMPITALEELVDQYRQQYPEAVFETTIPETGGEIPNGSVFRIAVEEAIENAVLHADRDPPHVELTVDPADGGDTATIEITDNGPGIPDSEWTIIKQGNETPLNHADSIGLWLLYWSVTALGGSVDRSANQPRGTVLSLQVPTTPGSTQ